MPRYVNGLRGPEAVLLLKGHRIWPSALNIFQEYQSPWSGNFWDKLLWNVSFLLLFLWSWLMNYTKYKMNSRRRLSLCFPFSAVLSIAGQHKHFRPQQSYTDWHWPTVWPMVLSPPSSYVALLLYFTRRKESAELQPMEHPPTSSPSQGRARHLQACSAKHLPPHQHAISWGFYFVE